LANGYESISSDSATPKPDIAFYGKTLDSIDYPSLLKTFKRRELLVGVATILQTINYSALIAWRLFYVFKRHENDTSEYEWVRCASLLVGWVSELYVYYITRFIHRLITPFVTPFVTDLRSCSRLIKIWKEA
jgi:NAD-dependent SIR2 family protein deacetylase